MTAELSYEDRAERAVRLRLKPAQYVERFGPPKARCTGCDHDKPDDHDAGGRLDRLVLIDVASKASWRFDSWGRGAFPSVEGIAARTGYCVRSVQYALRRLVASGYLVIVERPGRTHLFEIVRTVEPIGSVDTEAEPVDSAVDELVAASPPAAAVAPRGATVAPDLELLPTDRPHQPPDRGWAGSSEAADAAAHAPPRAARGGLTAVGTHPPAGAGLGAKPHRQDAGRPRAAEPAPPSWQDVGAGVGSAVGDLADGVEGDPPVERASRRVTRETRWCRRCGARPGESCRTRAGRPRRANHDERRPPRPVEPGPAYRPGGDARDW